MLTMIPLSVAAQSLLSMVYQFTLLAHASVAVKAKVVDAKEPKDHPTNTPPHEGLVLPFKDTRSKTRGTLARRTIICSTVIVDVSLVCSELE